MHDNYEQYEWFSDCLFLMRSLSISFWRCRHDPPLSSRLTQEDRESIDPYFIEQMKLEKKGWQSFCVASFSDFELEEIRRWATSHGPRDAYLQDVFHDEDVIAIVGMTATRSIGLTVNPVLIDAVESFLSSLMNGRPCFVITDRKITKKIKSLLPANAVVSKGNRKTAISMGLTDHYKRLVELL